MKRRWAIIVVITVVTVATLFAYANWPTNPLPEGTTVDFVLVSKSERKLMLLRNNQKIKEYRIALGRHPIGPKMQEGDGKTPEGRYMLDYRNVNSGFHRSLHVSYPDEKDLIRASGQGVSPGGLIMVHGLRNGLGFLGRLHRSFDWTNGCIAVTNSEIEEIWRCVPDGTPIEIRP